MTYHSYVFKKYLEGEKKNMSPSELVTFYKNSEFNHEFNLRKGISAYEAINESFKKTNSKLSEVEKLNSLLSQNDFGHAHNVVKLAHLYDKNLILKENV